MRGSGTKRFAARSTMSRIHQLEIPAMRSKLLLGGLLASAMLVPALAQSNPPGSSANPPAPAATAPAPATTAPAPAAKAHSDMWRASKLIGVNVYNDQNEKLGDISEILL